MKITCITTTFNEGALLASSVLSVLNQTYGNFQYIIVDDGASDQTRATLATLKDKRILLIRQENMGLSAARNAALARVTGAYVCFLDADDIRPNWAFQAMADVVRRDDPDLVLCKGVLSDARGNLLPFYDSTGFEAIEKLTGGGPVSPGHPALCLAAGLEPQSAAKLVRSALIRRHGLAFPAPHVFEDIFFHIAVLAAARRVSFLHSPCFSYFRRYGRAQITSARDESRFDSITVAKLTLAHFATTPAFADAAWRAAVLAACLRLVKWCEAGLRHDLRPRFRALAGDMIRKIDPLYAPGTLWPETDGGTA